MLADCLKMLVFGTAWCDRRLARLIAYILHTNDHRQWCHVGNTLSIVDWDFSETQTLLGALKTLNQLRVESYVFSDVEHLFRKVGCARSKHQCLTILQNWKLFLWMLVFAWTVSPLSISGTWLLKFVLFLKPTSTGDPRRDQTQTKHTNTKTKKHVNRDDVKLINVDCSR